MGGFRSLFKVRKPGNGNAVQNNLMSRKTGPAISIKSGTPNGGEKKSV